MSIEYIYKHRHAPDISETLKFSVEKSINLHGPSFPMIFIPNDFQGSAQVSSIMRKLQSHYYARYEYSRFVKTYCI